MLDKQRDYGRFLWPWEHQYVKYQANSPQLRHLKPLEMDLKALECAKPGKNTVRKHPKRHSQR